MSYREKEQGFTLIELLIVIVIIGILAGVLISVINPAQQTNRARDAGVQAAMNKVALATEGFVSAYGRAPNGGEFIGALQNAAIAGVAGAGCTTEEFCLFEVTGNNLPVGGTDGCGATNYSQDGANQCYYRYERMGGATGTTFNVYGKSFGIVSTVFKYTNSEGAISQCPSSTVNEGGVGC